MSKPAGTQEDVENVRKSLAATKVEDSELAKLQHKQRTVVGRALRSRGVREGGDEVHPDLQDLNFGELGEEKG